MTPNIWTEVYVLLNKQIFLADIADIHICNFKIFPFQKQQKILMTYLMKLLNVIMSGCVC